MTVWSRAELGEPNECGSSFSTASEKDGHPWSANEGLLCSTRHQNSAPGGRKRGPRTCGRVEELLRMILEACAAGKDRLQKSSADVCTAGPRQRLGPITVRFERAQS